MSHSFLFGTSGSTIDRVLRFGAPGEAFLFVDVADCMDDGYDHHQKAYLAVHAAEGSVPIVEKPINGSRYACDCGQQEQFAVNLCNLNEKIKFSKTLNEVV